MFHCFFHVFWPTDSKETEKPTDLSPIGLQLKVLKADMLLLSAVVVPLSIVLAFKKLYHK